MHPPTPRPTVGNQSIGSSPHHLHLRYLTNYRYSHEPTNHHHHNRFTAIFRDHPGQPVPEENFCTSWCKGRVKEADTLTIRLGVTPSGLTSAHLHHPPTFLQAGCPSCHPTNSVKALKALDELPTGWIKR